MHGIEGLDFCPHSRVLCLAYRALRVWCPKTNSRTEQDNLMRTCTSIDREPTVKISILMITGDDVEAADLISREVLFALGEQ